LQYSKESYFKNKDYDYLTKHEAYKAERESRKSEDTDKPRLTRKK